MAGYFGSTEYDSSTQLFEDHVNHGVAQYNLNLQAHYRPSMDRAISLSQGKQPSTYGPLRGRRVTQESFLQGRGQSLADCPECDVRWLPESLFPAQSASAQASCERTDIQPLYTRVPKSCNGIMETDITQYAFMPSAFQKGYTGYTAVEGTHIQSRQAPFDSSVAQGAESYGCRQNYGTFGSGRSFKRYS